MFSCYFPPTGSKKIEPSEEKCIFEALRRHIRSLEPRSRIVVLGDFNAKIGAMEPSTPGQPPRTNCDPREDARGRRLIRILGECGLIVLNGTSSLLNDSPTYSSRGKVKRYSTLDYGFCSPQLLQYGIRLIVLPNTGVWGWTDHACLVLDVGSNACVQ